MDLYLRVRKSCISGFVGVGQRSELLVRIVVTVALKNRRLIYIKIFIYDIIIHTQVLFTHEYLGNMTIRII